MMHLSSSIVELDRFFAGGLPLGSVMECGMPLGKEGRLLFVPFLAAATQQQDDPCWVLWVMPPGERQVLPSAWLARGLHPQRWVVCEAEQPVRDLQRVFQNPLFRCIVLDNPWRITRNEWAFLHRQARRHRMLIIVIRERFLTVDRGNVWCRWRWNAWRDGGRGTFHIHMIRGLAERQLTLPALQLSQLEGDSYVSYR